MLTKSQVTREFVNPTAELQRRGELLLFGDGRCAFACGALALWHWFDEQFARMARQAGAKAYQYPALIACETLKRAGYFEAFGEMATRVQANGAAQSHVLAPAVCYHCYAQFAGSRLVEPIVLTCVGKCFRHEPEGFESLGRLWEFTMREVVFLGPASWVEQQRREWSERVSEFAGSLNLEGEIGLASDPFFGNGGRGKKLLQQLKELKYELCLPVEAGRTLAVASFNLHDTFFGERFGLTLADGATAHTGCVAFGLERWTLAFLAQRGIEAAADLCRTSGL